ncbi:MAG: glucose-1-phosphate cytidylyltransferase [Leptolyngbya sp. IPPAS B-1204]|nr:glucose-1-phosphate cytidylyltransferase [Elainella sp. C42_A2020_010]RNJ65844.1 MAG: glucose-1-phosphate cytidylyltransferase [Leptolyngbya sp. IPPAS B-1204]
MKVGILAGGYGTRLAEETDTKPKPLVEIGGEPILLHIMRHYAHYGFNQFAIALGYKGEMIKRYMVDYCLLNSSLSVDFSTCTVNPHCSHQLDWQVDLVDTGLNTNTGGRIKRLAPYMGNETFMLTWGDGLSDVNLHELLAFHRAHGKLATMTAVRPPARFGCLELDGDQIVDFSEKPQAREGWINGAFFVLEPEVFDYIDGDDTLWEKEPLERLARSGQLMAYRHTSFWQCMDTLREKRLLESLWQSGKAPWKVWDTKLQRQQLNQLEQLAQLKQPNAEEKINEGDRHRTQGIHRHRLSAHAFRLRP